MATPTPLRAVSFDLWDTLVKDGSDEPKRTSRGLRLKRDERRHLVWTAASRHREISLPEVSIGYDAVDAACNRVWHDQHVTWTVRERLGVLLAGLGCTLPEQDMDQLV